MSRHRNWCATINNYTEQDSFRVLVQAKEARYAVVGREVGASGTPHLQCYFALKCARTLATMKKLLGTRAHLEVAYSSALQNSQYCKKENNFEEFGVLPENPCDQGKKEKTRWIETYEAAKKGRLDEIPPDIVIRHYGNLRNIAKDFMSKPPDLDIKGGCGIWIWGKSGVGKSFKARSDYPDAYFKPANKWWDAYQDEEAVILDDMDPKHNCLGYHLKIWSDRYSFIAEIKGGARHIRPKHFIVTSQYSIEDCFIGDEETQQALSRRFKSIHLLNNMLQ